MIKGEKQKRIEARTRSSFHQYFILPQLPGGGFKDLQCPRWWKWLQNDSEPPSAPTGNVKRSPAARIYTSALRLSEFGPAKLWGSERVLYFRRCWHNLQPFFLFWNTIPRHSRNAIFVKVTKNPFTTKAVSSARKVPRLNHGQRWKFQVGKPTGAKIAVQKLATHRWHGWINSPKFHGFKKHPEFSNPWTIDMCFFLHKGSHQEKSSRKEDISATPPPRQRSRSRQSVCNLVSDTPRPKLNEKKIDEFKPMNPSCHKLLPIRSEYESRACDSWA